VEWRRVLSVNLCLVLVVVFEGEEVVAGWERRA
jgi:hypothetical protein